MKKALKFAMVSLILLTSSALSFSQDVEDPIDDGCSQCFNGKRGTDSNGLATCKRSGSECMR